MPILIDAHVHIHPEFSLENFFSSAWNNFSRAVEESDVSGSIDFVLALTEGAGCDVFSSLKKQAKTLSELPNEPSSTTSWEIYLTAEPDSLIIRKESASMYLIAGKQLVSEENIELLSLFSSAAIEDRSLSLQDLALAVSNKGGLPVVPWGVGKWFGERGKTVERLLNTKQDISIFVGDNGNRPLFWPFPTLLKNALDLGIPILSGSDPLPLTSHSSRPGSFGAIFMEDILSIETPIDSLRRIFSKTHEVTGFGRGVGSFQFIIDQLQVNLRKQMGK